MINIISPYEKEFMDLVEKIENTRLHNILFNVTPRLINEVIHKERNVSFGIEIDINLFKTIHLIAH